MLGLLGIGVAVMLGVGLRISAVAGSIMMALMWVAEWPLEQGSTNPLDRLPRHLRPRAGRVRGAARRRHLGPGPPVGSASARAAIRLAAIADTADELRARRVRATDADYLRVRLARLAAVLRRMVRGPEPGLSTLWRLASADHPERSDGGERDEGAGRVRVVVREHRSIARAVWEGMFSCLPDVALLEVGAAPARLPHDVELLVVGGPTQVFGMSRPVTRADAQAQGGTTDSGPRRACGSGSQRSSRRNDPSVRRRSTRASTALTCPAPLLSGRGAPCGASASTSLPRPRASGSSARRDRCATESWSARTRGASV